MKIKKFVRLLFILFLVCVVAFTQHSLQFAQQKTEELNLFRSSQNEQLPESAIFERLFKMVDSRMKEADKQEKLGFPQRASALRTYFQRKAKLNQEQAQRLKEITDNFHQEVSSLKKQRGQIETSLKEQPDETNLLIELKDLYERRGGLWLKYRDSLHSVFGREKFEQFRQFLQEKIAAKIKRSPMAVKKHPELTAQKLSSSFDMLAAYNYSYSNVDYDENTNTLSGISVTWIEGGGGGAYFSEFSSSLACDPENGYCWNVSIEAQMEEPSGMGTPQSGEGCDGYIEVYFYPEYEIEEGDYCVSGDHAAQQNIGHNPYCGMQGADIYDFTNDCETVIIPKVNIILNGEVVTNTTQNVIVGQQINLSAQVTGGTPSNPQWTVPGSKVANYVVTYTNGTSPSTAVVSQLTSQNLTQSAINFYWVDGGDSRQVQYSVKVNNRTYTGKATFNVKRPTVTVTTATHETTIYRRGEYQELLFGSRSFISKNGIVFTRSDLQIPLGFSGNTYWVQVIDYAYTRTLPDDQTTETASGIGLDHVFPYASNDPNASSTADSPGVCLRICNDSTSKIKMQTRINAEMWLMFKPSNLPNGVNSIYVPLKKVSWSWSAVATRRPDFLFDLTSASNSQNPSGVDTTIFPQWSKIVTGNEPYQ